MKRMASIAIAGLLAFLIGVVAIPSEAISWRGHYHHFSHYGGHRFYAGYGPGFFFGFPIYGGYYPYGGYYYPGYYGYGYPESTLVYKEPPETQGFLRIDVQPADTEIFLDGEYLNKAGNLNDEPVSVTSGGHKLALRIGPYSIYYDIEVMPGSTSYFTKNLSAAH
jgi:hypothetical protein